jgi:hypothetical protein
MKGHDGIAIMSDPSPVKKKRRSRYAMCDLSKCKPVTTEDTLKYILGSDLKDWYSKVPS